MNHLRVLNKYFIKYLGRFFLGIVFVVISNIFAIVPAQLVRIALDLVAGHIETWRWLDGFALQHDSYASLEGAVFLFILLILSMTLLKGVFMFLMRQTLIVMSRCIEYDQKNEIFYKYLQLSPAFFNRNNTGDLMNRISEDVGRVRMYYGPAIMYTINLTVMFILVIYAMFHVNARLAWYVVIPLPVLSVIIYLVQDVINRKSEQVQAQLSSISTYVQESFSGIRVIKAFVREQDRAAGFNKEAIRYKQLTMDLARTNALFFPALLLMVGISTILTVFIGGLEVMRGSITMGNIAEFVIYINMLTWPVASLGWVVTLVQRAAASQRRINEFLNTVPEIVSAGLKPFETSGTIEFDHVGCTYTGTGRKAVSDICFEVKAGATLAITGRTGSGKSTLAALLLRLMDPTEGRILIDGHDLREIDLRDFRRQVGYVPQDVFLFSDTIYNNIAFGLGEGAGAATREQVEQAARQAAVYDNIMEFPAGFETLVGERGITLSGGQKQRISMARAIIRNPKILVFDDCLSAVDTKTEEAILTRMKEVMSGRASIIISHRVSAVRHADEILVLDEGCIVERGTHRALAARGGTYAALYEKQLLEEVQQHD